MITQLANSVRVPLESPGQPTPVAEPKLQKNATPVELPLQAVKKIGNGDFAAVSKATDQINELLLKMGRNLEFTVDKDTDLNVVKVVDTQSKEVVRQIPSPEVLEIAKALDKFQGLLIKEKA